MKPVETEWLGQVEAALQKYADYGADEQEAICVLLGRSHGPEAEAKARELFRARAEPVAEPPSKIDEPVVDRRLASFLKKPGKPVEEKPFAGAFQRILDEARARARAKKEEEKTEEAKEKAEEAKAGKAKGEGDFRFHKSDRADGHWENYRIKSRAFEHWLRQEYGRRNRVEISGRMVPHVPQSTAFKDAIATFESYAAYQGSECEPRCELVEIVR